MKNIFKEIMSILLLRLLMITTVLGLSFNSYASDSFFEAMNDFMEEGKANNAKSPKESIYQCSFEIKTCGESHKFEKEILIEKEKNLKITLGKVSVDSKKDLGIPGVDSLDIEFKNKVGIEDPTVNNSHVSPGFRIIAKKLENKSFKQVLNQTRVYLFEYINNKAQISRKFANHNYFSCPEVQDPLVEISFNCIRQ